jgi:CysZ protein
MVGGKGTSIAMLRAIALAIGQIFHPSSIGVLAKVAALTVLVFALLGTGLFFLFDRWLMPMIGAAPDSLIAAVLGFGLAMLGAFFLFRAVAMVVIGLFTDGIVDAVEHDHYPDEAKVAHPIGLAAGLRLGLRSGLRAIGWNLLALPFYLALLITGVGTLLLVLAVNTLILGRDFEAMVAARHPSARAKPLSSSDRLLLGLVPAVLFVIPIVNLAAPIVGAALAVHLFHLRPRREP